LLQPQNVEPALDPRRASLFTISALQTGQRETPSDESILTADFCVWRFSSKERIARMRERPTFTRSQTNGIPTTMIRMAQRMIMRSTCANI
jgi:hypothetical protein